MLVYSAQLYELLPLSLLFGSSLNAPPPPCVNKCTEYIFVNVYGAEESIPRKESIPPAYVAWRAGTTNRVVIPARPAGNRFLNSLKDLQIRTLYPRMPSVRGGGVWGSGPQTDKLLLQSPSTGPFI
jgi:hypothetical protein